MLADSLERFAKRDSSQTFASVEGAEAHLLDTISNVNCLKIDIVNPQVIRNFLASASYSKSYPARCTTSILQYSAIWNLQILAVQLELNEIDGIAKNMSTDFLKAFWKLNTSQVFTTRECIVVNQFQGIGKYNFCNSLIVHKSP